jgi:hypothetical protein
MSSSPHDPTPRSTAPTSLNDLIIPGGVGPLPEPPAEAGQTLWGINHGAALDNFPHNGLQLYIPAWSVMNATDSMSVLLDNVVVNTEIIEASEVGSQVTTFVEAVRLRPGNHTLQYRVTRVGQSTVSSAETHVLVKLERPGGKDESSDPGHTELKLTIPKDIIDNGVDDDTAKLGVPVTIEPYPEMAEGDEIKLSWGGEFVSYEVKAEEVDQPIVVTVPETTIRERGDSNANGLAVTYEVYDVVENRSEDWAPEIRIVVDTGNSRMPSPFVKESVSNVLDLNTLAGSAVTVQIVVFDTREMAEQISQSLASEQVAQLKASMGKETLSRLGTLAADFVVGDKITVLLTGTTVEHEPVFHEAPEFIVEKLGQILEVQIPNAVVRKLAQTQAVFSYRVIHEDDSKSASKGAFINVIGELVRMAAPLARDVAEGAIDPTLSSTDVDVPWDDSMMQSDRIILKWIGTRPDLTIYDPQLDPHDISHNEYISKLPITFRVPGKHLTAIEGGTLGLYFILAKDTGDGIVERESARATALHVGEPRAELKAPVVEGVVNGAIDPAHGATTLTVPVYTGMTAGDKVHYLWHGSLTPETEDWIEITSFTVNKPVAFQIKAEHISNNTGGTIEASYWVIRAGSGRRSDSEVLTFAVGVVTVRPLPAPAIVEAVGSALNPETVRNGAHVIIDAGAGIMQDDFVTLTWSGQPGPGSGTLVQQADKAGEMSFEIAYASVAANDGYSMTLEYQVKRTDDAPEEFSHPTVYDVHKAVGAGRLKIMGARFNRSCWYAGGTPLYISAFDAVTGSPVSAQWQYEGEDNAWATGTTFRDLHPTCVLQVRTSDDIVALNPGNIASSQYDDGPYRYHAVVIAHRDEGDLVPWGSSQQVMMPAELERDYDIATISSTNAAFAAMRHNGRVTAWGLPGFGGSLEIPGPSVSAEDFISVTGCVHRFVGVKAAGNLVSWGHIPGSNIPQPIAALTDIGGIIGNFYAFAALRRNGQVVAWGSGSFGGEVPADISLLTDIAEVTSSGRGFIALRTNGSLVGWGDDNELASEVMALTDVAELGCSNDGACSAIRTTGQVVVPNGKYAIPAEIASLTDIAEVAATRGAFAARRRTGHVVVWGEGPGSTLPTGADLIDDIVQVVGNEQAFAALRRNGAVMTWGDPNYGGDSESVMYQLREVQAVYAASYCFVALTSDGRVVTWGSGAGGGDSSAVQDRLRGQVSYHASPTSRGRALMTRRSMGKVRALSTRQ